MIFDNNFKKVLQQLPESEKDKLILRLLKKDLVLANRLQFELVQTATVEDKREELQQKIIILLNRATLNFYSPGYLLSDLKEISGLITEHLSITKDKIGEIILLCKMLCMVLELLSNKIAFTKYDKAYTFCIYYVSKVFKVLLLINKQHHDLHLDFKESVIELGKLISNNPHLMRTAINNGLDVNWLTQFSIPRSLENKYKEIRAMGLLR